MKPLKQVAQAYMALSDGQTKLQEDAFGDAEAAFRTAMEVTRTIPEEEVFDHDGFDALCHAGLSNALGGLGRYDESLASADMALRYFNRRGDLHQDEGVQWITAVISRARALARTGNPAEALNVFQTAQEMIDERKGNLPQKEALQKMVADNIAILRSSIPEDGSKRKAWWEFWS